MLATYSYQRFAAYHSNELYKPLRPCCKPLVRLLGDDDDKTRANAAGALGNFIRTSGDLIPDLIEAGALQAGLPLRNQLH